MNDLLRTTNAVEGWHNAFQGTVGQSVEGWHNAFQGTVGQSVEGWHNAFQRTVGQCHASVWKFIICLKLEDAACESHRM